MSMVLLPRRELDEAYEWLCKFRVSRKEAELHQVGAQRVTALCLCGLSNTAPMFAHFHCNCSHL